MKKLYRSQSDRLIAGVMGGVGEYYHIDPVLLRLGYVFLTVFTGFIPGALAYIFAILVVPLSPLIAVSKTDTHDAGAV